VVTRTAVDPQRYPSSLNERWSTLPRGRAALRTTASELEETIDLPLVDGDELLERYRDAPEEDA
jgi:hypothetical protein